MFVVRREVLAVQPVGDTILVSVGFTLPQGFGYLLNELHMNIEVDVADDYDSEAVWRLSRSSPQLGLYDYLEVMPFNLGGRNGLTRLVRSTNPQVGNLSRTPIIPGTTGATQTLSCQNLQTNVGAAGVINAVISFWEYDLEQIAYFPVHTATNVVGR